MSLPAARRRQNPRTGFVHEPADVIPVYENACFATALLREKQVATVLEGKELLLRLLAFQAPDGNFPVHLHDFPRCYDPHMGLRLGALWLQLLQGQSGSELRLALETSLQKIVVHAATRKLNPLWEFRRQVLTDPASAQRELDTAHFSADDWWEYWVSLQFLETPTCRFYNPELGALVPQFPGVWRHEGLEPAPHPIAWMAAAPVADHARQLQLSALRALSFEPCGEDVVLNTSDAVRMLWSGASLHTLVMPRCGSECVAHKNGETLCVELTLGELTELPRDDLFEVALFCDASPETSLLVAGRKATVFGLGEEVHIVTPQKTVRIRFEHTEGVGEFCGHIFRGSRPGQILPDVYDWKVALRTLRRQGAARLRITIS